MANAKKLDCTWPKARLEPRRLRVADDYLQGVLDGKSFLVFDGAMGTQLQARGLAAGELPELLCLTNPEEVTQIHAAYVAAGADAVTTNTFGANQDKLGTAATVEEIFDAAVACARIGGGDLRCRRGLRPQVGGPLRRRGHRPHRAALGAHGHAALRRRLRAVCPPGASRHRRGRRPLYHRDHGRPRGGQGGTPGREGELRPARLRDHDVCGGRKDVFGHHARGGRGDALLAGGRRRGHQLLPWPRRPRAARGAHAAVGKVPRHGAGKRRASARRGRRHRL